MLTLYNRREYRIKLMRRRTISCEDPTVLKYFTFLIENWDLKKTCRKAAINQSNIRGSK